MLLNMTLGDAEKLRARFSAICERLPKFPQAPTSLPKGAYARIKYRYSVLRRIHRAVPLGPRYRSGLLKQYHE